MTVSPGDSITASVTYESTGTYAGDYLLSINDTSQSNDSFSTYENPSQYQNPLPDRSTAEWIMETPSSGGTYATLPKFGSITFTNCNASISGTSRASAAAELESKWGHPRYDLGIDRFDRFWVELYRALQLGANRGPNGH